MNMNQLMLDRINNPKWERQRKSKRERMMEIGLSLIPSV